jgi:hypothetical protein
VTLDPEPDEYGVQRAFVSLGLTDKDRALWDAMDRAADEAAQLIAGGGTYEVLTPQGTKTVSPGDLLSEVFPYAGRRDTLGTTHHEAGTLWMGEDASQSVTRGDGRFHHVLNAYAAGPALFPTTGSPNPMLTGVALSRRTAELILKHSAPGPIEPGFTALFDGTQESFSLWMHTGEGAFILVDGAIVAQPGGDLGLLYYPLRGFGDFVLRLEFRLDRTDDNSGIFVRFRDPGLPVPDRNDPDVFYPYQNPAWVPVTTGYEVQINELARGDGLDEHRTGAIYGITTGNGPGEQVYRGGPALIPGEWNSYEIKVTGDTYIVYLNRGLSTSFTNIDSYRGRSRDQEPHSGYIGLQAHTGQVAFRNIRILAALQPALSPEPARLVTNLGLLDPASL